MFTDYWDLRSKAGGWGDPRSHMWLRTEKFRCTLAPPFYSYSDLNSNASVSSVLSYKHLRCINNWNCVGIHLQITDYYLLSGFFKCQRWDKIVSMVIGLWSLFSVCQPFSCFSFEACSSVLRLMLCANRPYTANSWTYPLRQRATGLLGLMDKTDHSRPRWKARSWTRECSRGGRLGKRPSQCCISSCSLLEKPDLIKGPGPQLWVVKKSLIYWYFRPCRVAGPTAGHPVNPDPWPKPPWWSVARQEHNKCSWHILLLLRKLTHAFDFWIMPICILLLFLIS